MSLAVGVDVGGTKIAAGLVDEHGDIVEAVETIHGVGSAADVVAGVAGAVEVLVRGRSDVVAVGVGVAGFIDADRQRMIFAPNLPLRDAPLRHLLAEAIARPVVLENDANAAAWGEYRFGAGERAPDLVAVTVGTGIGGGLVLRGELYRGGFGIAAEFGHVRVVPDGRPCGCGNTGCWEQYCSGPALLRAALARGATVSSGSELTAAAGAGDALALACFREVGGWLGQGLAELAAVLDPAVFVVGGGVAQAGEALLAPARARYGAALTGRGLRPLAEIRAASLGPRAGLVGAADLARREVVGCAS